MEKNELINMIKKNLEETDTLYSNEEGTFVLGDSSESAPEAAAPDPEVKADNISFAKSFFGALTQDIESTNQPEEEESSESEQPENSTKSEATNKDKPFNFSEEEIKAAIHGSLKRTKFSKVYNIYGTFSITATDINDKQTGLLNSLFADIVNQGELRTSVRVVDPYTDAEGKFIPGGRIEEEYRFNPDSNRLNMRALTAVYISHIDNVPLPELNELKDLHKRVEILETYSSELLDVIYKKVILPFSALMKEASERLLQSNF
jgi:hypothetical protein